jgi:hypothetical protein
MRKKIRLTAAEQRVIDAMKATGPALRIWGSGSQHDYSWWAGNRPATRIVHSLALKGHIKIEGDVAKLAA